MLLPFNLRFLLCLQLFVSAWSFCAIIDLEDQQQDFVLQTKKIDIQGYADAFNPSIVRWQGSLLLSFRFRDALGSADAVGLTWLDEGFKPVGEAQVLKNQHVHPAELNTQDPRLISVKDKLYLVYNNRWKDSDKGIRRMFIAEIYYDGVRFSVNQPEVFLDFDDEEKKRHEKNWVPFEYNGDLLLAYSLDPHKIFLPLFKKEKCATVALSEKTIPWKWGTIRGGTPALLVGNEYLAFFHSSKVLSSIQSKGESIPHYFMGAYTFESKPPFAITRVSPDFIVGKNFYAGPAYQTWKPLRVIFPSGFIFDEKYIWISYGRQDHEIWIVKLDREKLLKSLVKVP